MLRYRCWPCLGLLLLAGGCSVPSPRDNAAAASLVASKVPAPLAWRRDQQADRAARERAAELLAGGLTVEEAIGVAFLASPTLQLDFEQLEISRAELVGATRPANPVVVIGSREPGGELAPFYPDSTLSVGILQNLISLLTIPDRRAQATHNLERVRYEVAQRASDHAARVAEGWYRYAAAQRLVGLHEQSVNVFRTALDNLAVMAANGEAEEADVAASRRDLHGFEANLDRVRMDAADERANLEALLGIAGWRDDWQLAGELPPLPGTDPDAAAIEAAAITGRLDLQAGQKAIEMRLRQLSSQRRFRWLNQLEIGVFREKALGGTPFTGPTAAVELPLWDQRQEAVLAADAELRGAMRQLEVAVIEARRQIRSNSATVATMRRLVQRYDRDVLPEHQRAAAALGAGNPGELDRLNGRLAMLDAQREHIGLLRDYWVARSALAQAGGDWLALHGRP
ncbi:MAG TPA: TolC family protein [Steroidobacteraceae bacterium]|nr:TolC family protein [Steroidobacteraceae bacterium]